LQSLEVVPLRIHLHEQHPLVFRDEIVQSLDLHLWRTYARRGQRAAFVRKRRIRWADPAALMRPACVLRLSSSYRAADLNKRVDKFTDNELEKWE